MNTFMCQTNHEPETVTVACSPTDFEKARDELELNGYALVSCATGKGRLVLTGVRKVCSCDLCRVSNERQSNESPLTASPEKAVHITP